MLKILNRPPLLQFHKVHGENVVITENGFAACRAEGFCKSLAFSNRPIMIEEYICIKFIDVSEKWSGALRFGLTMHDPVTLKSRLPRYACPDLALLPGNWAKGLPEALVKKDAVLLYYVDQSGDVHYRINEGDDAVILSGVNISGKLWAVFDIYGNTRSIEFVNPGTLSHTVIPVERSYYGLSLSNEIIPHLRKICFHKRQGKNVVTDESRLNASRKHGCQGSAYVFIHQPIEVDQKIIIEITELDNFVFGNLVYGVTACNPETINPKELPKDSKDLRDRPEYWIVKEDTSIHDVGDLIAFSVDTKGNAAFFQLEIKNGTMCLKENSITKVFHVNVKKPLWMFFNIVGRVTDISLIGSTDSITSLTEYMNGLDLSTHDSGSRTTNDGPSDCLICCDEPADAVIYRCGHVCMCYACAMKNFKSKAVELCPICRQPIYDIIKMYK